MTLLERMRRTARKAAWKAGIVKDRTKAAAEAVERVLEARMEALAREHGVPGLSVSVRFAEGRSVGRAVGDAGGGRPMTPESVFTAGSLSKPVTAACALALVEKGALALDEPVWRRIRSWKPPPERFAGFDPEGVTLRRLLSHAAGLEHVIYERVGPGERVPLARDLLAACDRDDRALRWVHAPGERFRYSSGGYVLVQLLVEDATGTPFAEAARALVLDRLGMRASGYDLEAVRDRVVVGRNAEGGPFPPRTWSAPSDAGLFSTADDVARLFVALLPGARGVPAGRGAISPASCAEMLRIQVPHENGGGWGLGLRLKGEHGDVRFQHGGHDAGCFLHAQGLAGRRAAVVAMGNADLGAEAVLGVCRDVRHVLHRLAP